MSDDKIVPFRRPEVSVDKWAEVEGLLNRVADELKVFAYSCGAGDVVNKGAARERAKKYVDRAFDAAEAAITEGSINGKPEK